MHTRIHPSRPGQVANDAQGRSILNELQSDGVDTSYILVRIAISQGFSGKLPITPVLISLSSRMQCIHRFFQVSENGNSPFTYIIVDEQT